MPLVNGDGEQLAAIPIVGRGTLCHLQCRAQGRELHDRCRNQRAGRQQDAVLGGHAWSFGGAAGNVMVKVVPASTTDVTSIRPPCCSTMALVIESPRPVP